MHLELAKDSGICLFEKYLSENEDNLNISADLASAFISAISIFVDETFSDGIQNIEFQKRKLYFRFTDKLLFVFIFSKSIKIPKREQDRIMNQVIKNFYKRFGEDLDNEKFITHISNFKVFSEDIAEIMRAKTPIENLMNFIGFLKGEQINLT